MSTRNPFYLLVMLLVLFVLDTALRHTATEGEAPMPISPITFSIVVTVLSALFNSLMNHYGDTPLFALPGFLPLLGGPVTMEAIAYGATNGLVISILFTAFNIINRALPIRALIQFIPRAFYPMAVVISIAVTFVPTTLRQFERIREAQAVRGHRIRGLRDWVPLFMPLLIGGLERALQLAEAMTARGFASADEAVYDAKLRALVVLGLVSLLGGWLMSLVWGLSWLSGGILLCSGLLMGGVLWQIRRRVPRTSYRRETWHLHDSVVAVAVGAMAGILLVDGLPMVAHDTLFYSAYPRLSLPPFDAVIGIALLGIGVPFFFLKPAGDVDSTDDSDKE